MHRHNLVNFAIAPKRYLVTPTQTFSLKFPYSASTKKTYPFHLPSRSHSFIQLQSKMKDFPSVIPYKDRKSWSVKDLSKRIMSGKIIFLIQEVETPSNKMQVAFTPPVFMKNTSDEEFPLKNISIYDVLANLMRFSWKHLW